MSEFVKSPALGDTCRIFTVNKYTLVTSVQIINSWPAPAKDSPRGWFLCLYTALNMHHILTPTIRHGHSANVTEDGGAFWESLSGFSSSEWVLLCFRKRMHVLLCLMLMWPRWWSHSHQTLSRGLLRKQTYLHEHLLWLPLCLRD